MNKRIRGIAATGLALGLGLACGTSSAQDLGKLGGLLGGGGGSMSSGSMGNVAGLLQYCVKNNYLGGDSGASGIKDQLLGKLGGGASANGSASSGGDVLGGLMGKKKKSSGQPTSGDPTRDPSYLSGASGILQGKNGKSLDLSSVGGGSSDLKSQLTTKVCDTVLKQGKSFLGM
ncbi:DUF2501 domain-containing protein [Dyella marensis]|uniref:DUF2501 domain-containing protein n=1 Tax=Dyella marensis TaxID=500610 RepID=A0A1I2JJS3_9GAMM|nr:MULTISPECIES: DUF2501 domain-containing protein [Dyella]SFF54200.1 Protein of unknown function [Dyella marensis]